jgi:hypothetical protein
MEDGRPYRLEAREALAFAKLLAGNTAGARGDFVVLGQSLGAAESVQTRAQAAISLIDSGSMKALPAIVKAAAAAPPPVVIAPGAEVPGGPPMPQPQPTQPGAPQ